MFKVCGIIGISKIVFFYYSGNERVKQNQKTLKTSQNLLSLSVNHFSSNCNKIQKCFWFFTETITLSLPVPRCAGDDTNLPLESNISKTLRVNIAFRKAFFKEYSMSFLMVCRLIDFVLMVLKLLMFKICGIIGIEFFNYFGNERVKLE